MFQHIALFCGANRVCVSVRLKPDRAVRPRVWLPYSLLDLFGRHNPTSEVHVWHRPDRLVSPRPHQLRNGKRPIAHVVNFGDRNNRFVRSPDLYHVLVPDIDDALLGDKLCGVATRLVLRVGHTLTIPPLAQAEGSSFAKRPAMSETTALASASVDANCSLLVSFVFAGSTLLHGRRRVSRAVLRPGRREGARRQTQSCQ